MSGEADPLYIVARRVLLDALEALDGRRDAIVLVGAQAIYLHTGEVEFSVPAYTTDADIVIDPAELRDKPELERAMAGAGFVRDLSQPGMWRGRDNVQVDLLVPDAVGGGGRRGARLGVHGNQAARKARGLEAALVDREPMIIESLEGGDLRRFEVMIASPAALLVAKLHKIAERRADRDRLADKDALDVFRILRSIPTEGLAASFPHFADDDRSREIAREAVAFLVDLFGSPEAQGCQMAARAVVPLENPVEVAAASAVLAGDLLASLDDRNR